MRQLFLLLVALAGCADVLERDVGPLAAGACQSVDSDPMNDVSFADDVGGLLESYHCATCHTPGGATPIGLSIGGLDLSSYRTLRLGGTRSDTDIVVPGSPCSSVLVQKLSAGPPFGSRMPLDGPPYLAAYELAQISDWIVEGAHDN